MEALKNSSVPSRGDFFKHGFNEQHVAGYLCCKYNWPWTGWFVLMQELKMLYLVNRGDGFYKYEEPPVKEGSLIRNFVTGRGELNGNQYREVAKENFEELMMIGVTKS
jgi:hypothetical protein